MNQGKGYINQNDFIKRGQIVEFGDYFSPNYRNYDRRANGQVIIPLSPFVHPNTKIYVDDNPQPILWRAFKAYPVNIQQKLNLQIEANTNMTQAQMDATLTTKPPSLQALVLPNMDYLPKFDTQLLEFEMTWLAAYTDKFFDIYANNVSVEFSAFGGEAVFFQIGYDDKSTTIYDYVTKNLVYKSVRHEILWDRMELGITTERVKLKVIAK